MPSGWNRPASTGGVYQYGETGKLGTICCKYFAQFRDAPPGSPLA